MFFPQIDTSLYDDYHTSSLMEERGIKRHDERSEDVFKRVIGTLVRVDSQMDNRVGDSDLFLKKVVNLTEDKTIVYGTPILANVGRTEDLPVGACTVLNPIDKNGEININKFIATSRNALRMGIGTGYDLSSTTDPVKTLHEMDEELYEINRELRTKCKRPSASMITLRATHPEILNFISAKKKSDFSKSRINISVLVAEELFEKASNDGDWSLMDENESIVDTIPAKVLIHKIAETAHYCGEPGILFKDRLEKDNPTPQWEYISTAPCAELAMAEGDLCHFSYINLASLVKLGDKGLTFDFASFGQAVAILVRLLDAAVQITVDSKSCNSMISERRRIGIGITGFASLLMRLDIPYASAETIKLAELISEYLDFHAKNTSMLLAQRRGAFPAFKNSKYTDVEWLKRKNRYQTGILTKKNWEILYGNIQRWGVRNASTTVFPPAGTSSKIAHVSTSLEPYFNLVECRRKETGTSVTLIPKEIYSSLKRSVIYPNKMNEIVKHILAPTSKHMLSDLSIGTHFSTARQILPMYHLRVAAAFQKFADDGVAKTINMANNTTIEEVYETIWEAYRLGLKGFTIFRDECLNEREL